MVQDRWMRGYRKTVPVFPQTHSLQSVSHSFRIAVPTAEANFRAARYGIPGGFGPLNRTSHSLASLELCVWCSNESPIAFGD